MTETGKQPHFIHQPDAAIATAGIVSAWPDPNEEQDDPDKWRLSMAIITRDAHVAPGEARDRMPACLTPDPYNDWLGGHLPADDVLELLHCEPPPPIRDPEVGSSEAASLVPPMLPSHQQPKEDHVIIFDTIEDFKTLENAPASGIGEWSTTGEADWGHRLRGAGAPGGDHGWLLTFLLAARGLHKASSGWLIAYEVKNNKKTGRLALLRRDWTGELDQTELARIRSQQWWNGRSTYPTGEADLETIDREVAGTALIR